MDYSIISVVCATYARHAFDDRTVYESTRVLYDMFHMRVRWTDLSSSARVDGTVTRQTRNRDPDFFCVKSLGLRIVALTF
jgi:hypothetical protein